ncbi:MAG: extracellular solute-binding protein [Spirochaetaceae bacterium]
MKKLSIIYSLLIIVLLILFLAGCKNDKITPYTTSILYNDVESAPFNADWKILEKYKTDYNITFDVKLGSNKDYGKALDLYLSSDIIPDIILKVFPSTIEKYAIEGKLLPISDYENLMPNYKTYIEKHNLSSEVEKLKLDNNKYYLMPGFQRETQVQQWIYRYDLFEKHNLATPKTYLELFDSLVILKELYPESTPITASWGGAHLFSMMGAGYGISGGWSGTRFYDFETKNWTYAPGTENYRQMYTFLNKCYEAGVLDQGTFNQSNEDFMEKIQTGKALVTVTWITSGFDKWNKQLKVNGFENAELRALPVMESTVGLKSLPAVNKFRKGLALSATVVDKPYFEDLIKFLDWVIYSEDGMELTTWGEEGITYEKNNNIKTFLSNIKTPKNQNGTVDISAEYGFNLIFNLNENEEYEDFKKPKEIVTFLSNSEKEGETMKMNPVIKLGTSEIDVIALVDETLVPYVNDVSLKFITGELDIDNDWDSYITEIENIGYKILEETWNKAWDRQK